VTFFDDWTGVARIALFALAAYSALLVVLRLTGKRTIAKFNIYDWAVSVAFGSTLATIVVSDQVALAEGVAALVTLALLQYVVSAVSIRWERTRDLVTSRPALVFHRGDFCREAMARERITEGEILHAMRARGHSSLHDVDWVVFETDGTFSVGSAAASGRPTLRDVAGFGEPEP
jgi:uncharacterized membrane protein YcaP (DUF421 family)